MERRRFSPPWPEKADRNHVPPLKAATGALRAAARLILASALLLVMAAGLASGRKGFEATARRKKRYCSTMLTILGGRVRSQGRPPSGPALIVANHHSWLDGLSIGKICAPAFTAYARDWPLVSFILRKLGVVELPRGSGSGLPLALRAVSQALKSGERVCVFPEATTSFGPEPLEYKPAFFQTAVDAGVPVIPVAITFHTPAPWPSPERVIHWVDWTPFLIHAARIAALPYFIIDIEFGLEIRTESGPARERRRVLASLARSATLGMLGAAAPSSAP